MRHPKPQKRTAPPFCRKCQKTTFRDRTAASLEISRISDKQSPTGTWPNRPYRCPHRNGWHLTSKPKKA